MVLGVEPFYLAYALDGPLFQGMASKGIGGVGGVDDDTTLVQYVDDSVDVAARVVLFVEFQ